MMTLLAATGDDAFGGLLGLALFVIGIVWFVFPFIVVEKFNHLIRLSRAIMKEQQASNAILGEIRDRKLEVIGQKSEAKPAPIPAGTPRRSEATTAPEVYRID